MSGGSTLELTTGRSGELNPGPARLRLTVFGHALLAALIVLTIAVSAAYANHYHNASGYDHGLADGYNNNGFVGYAILRNGGTSASMWAERYQSGNYINTYPNYGPGFQHNVYPSINECHEHGRFAADGMDPHPHYHDNYCY